MRSNSLLYRPPPGTDVRLNPNSPQAAGLIGWWPLRDGSPEIARDYSGYGYDIAADPTSGSNMVFSPSGTVGAATGFESSGSAYSNHSNLPSHLQLDTGDNWLISMWLNCGTLPETADTPTVFGWYGGGATAWILFRVYDAVADYEVYMNVKTTGDSSGSGIGWNQIWPIGREKWVHIAGFQNSVDRICHFYFNGTLSASTAARVAGNYFQGTYYLHIGAHPVHSASRDWVGQLADIRMYNRDAPFTPEDVWQMYDPATRWDLYLQEPRITYKGARKTMGRMYSVNNTVASLTTAADMIEINAPSDAIVVLHSVHITQETEFGDAAAEMLDFLIHRGSTSGSAGATPTAAPLEAGDAAFGGTVETGNTTQGTEGTVLHRETAHVASGFHFVPTPEERIVISPSGRLIIELGTAPDDSIDLRVSAVFEEIGG